jgi:microcystin degradation protein MlrC
MRCPARPASPVVIADVEDNAGGGGSSDTTGLLRALIEAGADNAILALMNDPAAAALAHAAGSAASSKPALGGRSGCDGDAPLVARFEVTALSDGAVPFEGEVYRGGTAQIGPTACLRVLDTPGDIRVVVGSVRNQCLDRAYFRHIGLTPGERPHHLREIHRAFPRRFRPDRAGHALPPCPARWPAT